MTLDDGLDLREQDFHWYTLRVLRNEEKCVDQIKEHISMRKLKDRIVDVRFFKEYEIVESEDYSFNSDLLPKRGLKSTHNSIWVRVSNEKLRRIRIVKKRIFEGMIFLKMDYDMELFKLVRSWDAGFSFLGFPNPSAVSDHQMKKTEESIKSEIPDLREYAKSKGYFVIEDGFTSFSLTDSTPNEIPQPQEEIVQAQEEEEIEKISVISEEEKLAARKAEIYSDLKIKEYDSGFSDLSRKKSDKKKSKDLFKVNDVVFIKSLGFQGIIQEIDYASDYVVVGVRMFGRRQPIESKISDISIKIFKDSNELS